MHNCSHFTSTVDEALNGLWQQNLQNSKTLKHSMHETDTLIHKTVHGSSYTKYASKQAPIRD